MLEYLYCHEMMTHSYSLAHRRALKTVKSSNIFKCH